MPAKKKADEKEAKTKKATKEKAEEKKTKKTTAKKTEEKKETKKTTAKKTTKKKAEEVKKEEVKKEEPKEVVVEEIKENVEEIVIPKGEILQIDQTSSPITLKSQERKIWEEIEQEQRQGLVINGYIEGVETEPSLLITSSYKNKKVIIPISESGINLITEESTKKDKKWRYERVITSMLGAPIQFVMKGVDRKNNIIAASRKDALNRARIRYYGGTNPLITKGRVVEARVIAVKERNVRFEVFGVDVVLGISELSHEWISDARDSFYVGDIVPVLVEDITFDNSKKRNSKEWCESIEIKINAKATQEDRTIAAYEHAEVEGRYFGTVTNIVGNIYFIALANGANAVAHAYMTNPKTLRGDKVCFLCKKKEKSKHILSGIIIRTIMSDFKQ